MMRGICSKISKKGQKNGKRFKPQGHLFGPLQHGRRNPRWSSLPVPREYMTRDQQSFLNHVRKCKRR